MISQVCSTLFDCIAKHCDNYSIGNLFIAKLTSGKCDVAVL